MKRAHRIIPTPLDGDAVDGGSLTLSMVPPSLNNIFANRRKGGRMKTAVYGGWLSVAHMDLRRQPSWHVPGKVKIALTFSRCDTRADLDNLIKPTLDLLVAAGRIADDRNVVGLEADFGDIFGVKIDVSTIPLHASQGRGR